MDTWRLAPCLLTLGEAGGKYLKLRSVQIKRVNGLLRSQKPRRVAAKPRAHYIVNGFDSQLGATGSRESERRAGSVLLSVERVRYGYSWPP